MKSINDIWWNSVAAVCFIVAVFMGVHAFVRLLPKKEKPVDFVITVGSYTNVTLGWILTNEHGYLTNPIVIYNSTDEPKTVTIPNGHKDN